MKNKFLNSIIYPSNKTIFRFNKRIFDITISSILLILLSPLFLIIAVLIKLENKGPVFYSSKRIGEGYRVFPFYKFRSMRTDADQLLEKMKEMNKYNEANNDPDKQQALFSWENGDDSLVADEGFISENDWKTMVTNEQKMAFVKFNNDPRITKIGKFIRNTSIDELPQLFNVLKGDMSLVGNRPLPLYEASKLTSDDAIGRFLAPAGITGLWQVTERGTGKGDTNSRKRLDVVYAEKCNFWLDMWILFKTPLAALQQENV